MALPITGPTNVFSTYPFGDAFQRRYKQARPYNLPLNYEMYNIYGCRVDDRPSGITRTKEATFDPYNHPQASYLFTAAANRAYERMRSKLVSQSGWAENLAQIGKTRLMVNQRATQLASIAVAIRKGRFKDASRLMRTPIPSGVSNRKAVGQNFLEWEFGWKPIFSDLVSSLDALTSFPDIDMPIEGKSSERLNTVLRTSSSAPGQSLSSVDATNAVYHVRMGATVTITNPNLFLANQLGVIDFALPWKLLPFSFVVDWFVNVEQTISSISDWYGVQLQHQYTTRFAKGTRKVVTRNTFWNTGTGVVYDWLYRDFERDGVHIVRVPSISYPVLIVKPFKGFSIQRGAQAISLVLSVLGK